MSGIPSVIETSATNRYPTFTVAFQAPAATDTNWYLSDYAPVQQLETTAPPSVNYQLAVQSAQGAILPNTALRYTLQIPINAAPGRYQFTIPITQGTWDGTTTTYTTVRSAPVTVNVRASASFLLAKDSLVAVGTIKKSSQLNVIYSSFHSEKGLPLTAYYKPKGATKYTKLFTVTLDSIGAAVYRTKAGQVSKAGTGYYTVPAGKYSDAIKGTFEFK